MSAVLKLQVFVEKDSLMFGQFYSDHDYLKTEHQYNSLFLVYSYHK